MITKHIIDSSSNNGDAAGEGVKVHDGGTLFPLSKSRELASSWVEGYLCSATRQFRDQQADKFVVGFDPSKTKELVLELIEFYEGELD